MRRVITAAPDWPGVKWPWTVIHWGRSIVRPAINWIAITRPWNECGGNRCRRPDYGACHGEWKDKWVIVTLSLRPDACQDQKQHQTDAKNKTFPFHDTPPIARFTRWIWTCSNVHKGKRCARIDYRRGLLCNGSIGLCFSTEGISQTLILHATADS